MRVPTTPEVDGPPPPPYTPQDPIASANHTTDGLPITDRTNEPAQASLRGGYMRPTLTSELSEESNLSSAATYFEDRPLDGTHALYNAGVHLNLIEHNITLNSRTTRDELPFPRPADMYLARGVTAVDWSTFVNYLLPVQRGTYDKKAGETSDEKKRSADSDSPERRENIQAVIAEWNEGFFGRRLIRIIGHFDNPLSSTRSPSSSAPQRVPLHTEVPISYDTSRSQHHHIPLTQNRSLPDHLSPPVFSGHPTGAHRRRQSSISSTSSSSSSSSESIDSISSKDLEGADLGQIRAALTAFRLDLSKKDHLRSSVRQLRDEFRSQRRDVSFRDRKELKKEYKEQRKEIKKEIKSLVKESRAARKADKKTRKFEKRCRKDGKRAERRHDRGLSAVERSREHLEREQRRGQEHSLRAQEHIRERPLPGQQSGIVHHSEVYDNPSREAEAAGRAQERAAHAQTSTWGEWGQEQGRQAERKAREHAREASAAGIERAAAGTNRAREAEERAWATARDMQGREWGSEGRERAREAEARAQDTARTYQSRDWGNEGRERAKEAEGRAQDTARTYQSRDWGSSEGRNRATEAEQRARTTAANATSDGWGQDAVDRAQETARNYQSQSRDWGSEGRARARDAEERARETARRVA